MDEREIAASKLGTEVYWNEFYDLEINNFNQTGDQGECWFGIGLLKKVIKWIDGKLKSAELNENELKVLDIGSGNGLFLFELVKKLNLKHLYGLDYSENSVRFSNLILERDYSQFKDQIEFRRLNILEPIDQQIENFSNSNWKEFNLLFDKGTFDAICLNPDPNFTLAILKSKYRKFLGDLLSEGGLFILCSCNWSKEELINDFVGAADGLKLELIDEIKQSSFVFGGQAGNSTTCLILKRI